MIKKLFFLLFSFLSVYSAEAEKKYTIQASDGQTVLVSQWFIRSSNLLTSLLELEQDTEGKNTVIPLPFSKEIIWQLDDFAQHCSSLRTEQGLLEPVQVKQCSPGCFPASPVCLQDSVSLCKTSSSPRLLDLLKASDFLDLTYQNDLIKELAHREDHGEFTPDQDVRNLIETLPPVVQYIINSRRTTAIAAGAIELRKKYIRSDFLSIDSITFGKKRLLGVSKNNYHYSPDCDKVIIWDIEKNERLYVLDQLNAGEIGPVIVATNEQFAVSNLNGKFIIWNLTTHPHTKLFETGTHAGSTSLSITSDSNYIIGTGYTRKSITDDIHETITAWRVNCQTTSVIKQLYNLTFNNAREHVVAAAISPDDKILLVGTQLYNPHRQTKFHFFDVKTGKYIKSYEQNNEQVSSLAFSADGEFILTSYYDEVCIFNRDMKQVYSFIPYPDNECRTAVATTLAMPRGNHTIITGRGNITAWDVIAKPAQ